jgi:lipopolysaccharide/colanic/teichoic acid biosynthesis glycosyltransferase
VAWLEQEIPGYSERVRRVRPGITGWAQVHCPYDATVDDVRQKVLYDLAYVVHLYRFSTFLKIELRTLFATVAVMVGGRGAR